MASTSVTQPSNVAYDVNIGGIGFFLDNNSETPYRRQTAPYKKEQSDNSNEPGEQSLQGWWYRSQSSFHLGAGIKFYEPQQDEKLQFRFEDSSFANVWTQGQVGLLNSVGQGHTVLYGAKELQSINDGSVDSVLSIDGFDADKILADGSAVHYIDYNSSTEDAVYSICNDGNYAYWITNYTIGSNNRWHVFKKPLSGDTTTGHGANPPTGDVTILGTYGSNPITVAKIAYVKGRVILAIADWTGGTGKAEIWEMDPINGTKTSIYTHSSATVTWTDIAQNGSSIFVSGYEGSQSFILRLTVGANGDITALNGAVTAAEMPRGENVYCMGYYMGYLAIGTSKGLRIAQVSDAGDIAYGPLIFESAYPVKQVAFNSSFVYAATRVNNYPGLYRVDLSTQIDTLRFPYAKDLYSNIGTAGIGAGGVAFIGNTNKLCFASDAAGYYYVEINTANNGWLLTGRIRFNTLENKLFKTFRDRTKDGTGNYYSVYSVNAAGTETLIASFNQTSNNAEWAITPSTPTEYLQFKIYFGWTSTFGNTKDPTWYGYQIKALPSAGRQRLIQYPLMNYDIETDRYNQRAGYDGKANAVLSALEDLENLSDTITVTDNRTGETYTAIIEEVSFMNTAPPDKRYEGYGGKLTVTVRKI